MLLRRGSSPVPAGSVADHLSGEQAETIGSRLSGAGRHIASLPYYRRIVDLLGTEWIAHSNYSSALHNAAQESRVHVGKLGPGVRSSVERMALMVISQREQDLAERHARSQADRALVLFQRGQTLQTWGFPLDALAEYRRALQQTPGDPNLTRVETTLTELLAHGGEDGERR